VPTFIRFETITPDKAKVTLRHTEPETLSAAILATGQTVDSVPDPAPPAGKIPELYVNPQTWVFSYEYTDPPKSEWQLLQDAQEKISQLTLENEQRKQESADTTSTLLDLYELISPGI
jgi:hypothetical protein